MIEPHPYPDASAVRHRVDAELSRLLSHRAQHLVSLDADLLPVADSLVGFCAGGKRIRPLFAYYGWLAAGGTGDDRPVIAAAASLELVQAAALVHDDIIDDSDSRRGMPSVHRRFATTHDAAGRVGDPERHGVSIAILVGDLALIWADAMLHDAGLPDDALLRARRELDLMRIEVMAGQYLDLHAQAYPTAPDEAVNQALRVAELKSASYTVTRPLLIGAALAGAPAAVRETFTRLGHHVGIAFQLRDDLLGVFGDPALTGKPAGDDLREGKRTALVALALDHLGHRAHELSDHLGDPSLDRDRIGQLRDLIAGTGAPNDIEQLIDRHSEAARETLASDSLSAAGRRALDTMIDAATSRAR